MTSRASFLVTVLLLIFIDVVYSQTPSSSHNYIREDAVFVSGILNSGQFDTLSNANKSTTITYIDGLGRPIQSILVGKSPSLRDMVQAHEYDSRGNESIQYLPYTKANNSGAYITTAVSETGSFYQSAPANSESTSYPYSQTVYENSPLNRVLQRSNPGESWNLSSDHILSMEYRSNLASEVKQWVTTSSGLPTSNGYYPAGTLFVTVTIDENNHKVATFEDLNKKVVQVSSYFTANNSTPDHNDVSYVYNDLDLLSNVVMPEANAATSQENMEDHYYCYTYNAHKQVIDKKIPGQSHIFYIYDTLDRVILEQDGNLAGENNWMYKKYDILNRVILEGIYHHSTNLSGSAMQSLVDGYYQNGTYKMSEHPSSANYDKNQGYSNQAFPPNNACLIQEVYDYDTYDFDRNGSSEKEQFFVSGYDASLDSVKGKLTSIKSRLVNDTSVWRQVVYFYDSKYRILQQDEKYSKRKISLSTINRYLFSGVLSSKTVKFLDDSLETRLTYSYNYSYDQNLRLKSTTFTIPNVISPVEIEYNSYNELGQLISQGNHYAEGKYVSSYVNHYNIRNWLIGMNVNGAGSTFLLKFNLYYDQQPTTASSSNFTPQYNGNISSQTWINSTSDTLNEYDFRYDDLNRLLNAKYSLSLTEGGGSGGGEEDPAQVYQNVSPTHAKGVGSEGNISYDRNGNILTLNRNFRSENSLDFPMDKLTYFYIGNRIRAVDDSIRSSTTLDDFNDNGNISTESENVSVVEYSYDETGNMTSDVNRNLNNYYNTLNLPQYIYHDNGYIKYDYDHTGVLFEKQVVYDGTGNLDHMYRYYGDIVVDNDTIKQLMMPTGCLQFLPNGPEFNYHIKDHLGNVRVVIRPNSQNNPEVLQKNDYYPFGMVFSTNLNLNNKLYNGKELQTEMKYSFYNYGARFYDPQLARWHSVDPLAEQSRRWSPYVYGLDNPIRFIDPDGRIIVDSKGNTIYTQKGGWAKNASTDAQRIQSALDLTRVGAAQWNKMVNSPNKINLNISDQIIEGKEPNTVKLGTTDVSYKRNSETNKPEFQSDKIVKVTVFEKAINENTQSNGQVNEGLTNEQALGATAGHEAEHATNPNNIEAVVENIDLPNDKKNDVESAPKKVGEQIRQESREKNDPVKRIEPKGL